MSELDTELLWTPSEDLKTVIREAWSWLLKDHAEPWRVTLVGDAFLKTRIGEILWLQAGAGSLSLAAPSEDAFWAALVGEEGELWLLPNVVSRLRAADKLTRPGECYTCAPRVRGGPVRGREPQPCARG